MALKGLFCQASSPLPIELVDEILDMAEYWAHSSVTLQWHDSTPGVRRDRGANGQVQSNKMYMRMPPLGMYGVDEDLVLEEHHHHAATLEELRKLDAVRGLSGDNSASGTSQKKVRADPRGEHPCRKIVFNISSHDQGNSFSLSLCVLVFLYHTLHHPPGWGGHHEHRGTYRGSYTWFDVSVERPSSEMLSGMQVSTWPAHVLFHESDSRLLHEAQLHFTRRDQEHPFLPPSTHLQRNITARSETQHHSVTWHYNDSMEENSPATEAADSRGQGWKSLDGTFVRSLRTGDCITLWSRARFPGWRSEVENATITVYWAV